MRETQVFEWQEWRGYQLGITQDIWWSWFKNVSLQSRIYPNELDVISRLKFEMETNLLIPVA